MLENGMHSKNHYRLDTFLCSVACFRSSPLSEPNLAGTDLSAPVFSVIAIRKGDGICQRNMP